MKKRRKRKLFKILLLLIIIIFVLCFKNKILDMFVYNRIKDKDTLTTQKDYSEIVSTSESDSDIIKEIFAEGMKTDEYKKILDQEDNYIENTHDYVKLEYDFTNKLSYSDIEEYLNNLNKSNIVKLENIGSSVDNRTIYSIEIGKGKDTVLIDANIHAAETANTLILLKYIINIVNDYESGKEDIVSLLDNVKLVVLPCINPDGYEVYNFGVDSLTNKNLWIYKNKDTVDFENFKFNANGVDINRNMPTENAGLYYKKYDLISSVSLSKTTSNGTYFGGTSLGSEPETKALMYFMLKHYKNTIYYINMHSQGRIIYQGKPNLSSEFNNLCKTFANKISSYNDYKVKDISSEEVGEGNDGSATDFMSELANGLKFSESTGRLSMKQYENNDVSLIYKYPVITLETLNRYTRDPNYYKEEYIYRNYEKLFNSLLSKNIE